MGVSSETLNAITIDVEEHFQVSAFEHIVDRNTWDRFPSRVAANTDRLLALFDKCGVKATFFVLGWIGERHPQLVKRIADRGHEIACHGYDHRLLYELERPRLESDTRRARNILQDLSGQSVNGYRAASFSIGSGNLWALDVLAELGFNYDSSIFPIVHDRYGIPGAPRGVHVIKTGQGGTIVEIPPSTVVVQGRTLPVAGGGYLRILPATLTHWAIRRLNREERVPVIVYVHPWEVDPQQPRISAGPVTRLRHYTGLRTVERKLEGILTRYRFGTMADLIATATATVTTDPAEAGWAS